MRLLVDASGLCYRAAYKQAGLVGPDGQGTGVVFGVLRSLEKIAAKLQPEEMVICWDGGYDAKSRLYPEYKANRVRDPEFVADLRRQQAVLREALRSLPVVQILVDGIEADDVIAVVCRFARLETVGILTGDHDLYQLASSGGAPTVIYNLDGSPARLKLRPSQYLTYSVLVGKSSNNVKGVAQIGDVRATGLIRQHGTLKSVMQQAKQDGKLGAMTFAEAMEVVRRNLALMAPGKLVSERERKDVLDQYRFGRLAAGIDAQAFLALLKRIGATSIISRLSGYLMAFKQVVRTRNADEETAHASVDEKTAQGGWTKRVRNVCGHQSGKGSNPGEPQAGVRGRCAAEAPNPEGGRVRQTATSGAGRGREHRGAAATVRAAKRRAARAGLESGGDGADDAGEGDNKTTRQRRVESQRRQEALQIITALQTDEGWEWLRARPVDDLILLSAAVTPLAVDASRCPPDAVLSRLRSLHLEFLAAMPEWM